MRCVPPVGWRCRMQTSDCQPLRCVGLPVRVACQLLTSLAPSAKRPSLARAAVTVEWGLVMARSPRPGPTGRAASAICSSVSSFDCRILRLPTDVGQPGVLPQQVHVKVRVAGGGRVPVEGEAGQEGAAEMAAREELAGNGPVGSMPRCASATPV